ncbi:20068_t:CDS:1, partial [Racocetra fulgida]
TLLLKQLESVQEIVNENFNGPLDAEQISKTLKLTMEFVEKMLKNDNKKEEITYLLPYIQLALTARRISPSPAPSMFATLKVPIVKPSKKDLLWQEI